MGETVKRVVNFCAIYYFIVVVFSIEVLTSEVNKSIDIIDQVFPIIFLCIYPLFYFLIVWASKKRREADDVEDYYETQFPDVNSLKKANESEFSYCFVYLMIISAFMIVAMLVVYREAISLFLEEFHGNVWLNESVSTIISIVVGIYAFLFAFFPIIISYLKDKCLFFEPFDIPIINWSRRVTVISLVIVIIYIILLWGGAKLYWMGACEFLWILLMAINVIIYIMIFAIPVKIEKRVLKKIHHLFGRRKIYMTPNKKWWKGSVIRQIAYLLEEYKKSLYKINSNCIEDIEFACVLSKKKENIILAKKRFYILVGVTIVIMLLFGLVLPLSLNVLQKRLYLVITLIALMPFLIPALDHLVIINNYAYINRLGYFSVWGYYVKLANRDSRIYISTYDVSSPKYKKCLVNLKRLVCFYNLAINMKYEDAECVDDIGIGCLCDYIRDLSKRGIYQQGMLAPVLICACLSEKKKEENALIIKEMLCQLEIDNEEQSKSIEVSLQVLRNLYGDDLKFNKMQYERTLFELFE